MAIVITISLLALMEIALSFDNAVINANILKNMNPVWQKRFLTWGILIAVMGMRLVFPIEIVSIAGGLSTGEVISLAVNNPAAYAEELATHHVTIASFGGMFLLLVFLSFILNPGGERTVFWIIYLEQKLARLGLLRGIEIVIAGAILVVVQHQVPLEERLGCLLAGMAGIGTYMLLEAVTRLLETDAIKSGLAGFLYLEVLDASCSLDGVIGAFVLTDNILFIMLGLGIGAMAVRFLTLYLVRGGIMQEYIYLEHGAHYGIGALATIMLIDTFYAVPEYVTGSLGVLFIGAAVWSSAKEIKNN